jgi:hypothetical protein
MRSWTEAGIKAEEETRWEEKRTLLQQRMLRSHELCRREASVIQLSSVGSRLQSIASERSNKERTAPALEQRRTMSYASNGSVEM